MSAPAPAFESQLTLDQGLDLLDDITRDDHGVAQPLFLLLRGVVDPNGDREKFAIADELMRRVIVKTPQFEEWYRSQLVA